MSAPAKTSILTFIPAPAYLQLPEDSRLAAPIPSVTGPALPVVTSYWIMMQRAG